MLYRSLLPRDMFADLDRLQREMQGMFDVSPAIRGPGRGGYPALNVGTTPSSVEVHAFAPGLDPGTIELNLDRGVLTLSGERKGHDAPDDGRATLHMQERFAGRFRRVVNLPDDIDPNGVSAEYRDGVLRVSIKRRDAVQPRRIPIQ
ncbi:MAG: Hsp20/alpha crystallin family protein [Aquabacterium sp.]